LRLKILKKLRTASLNSEFTGSYKKSVLHQGRRESYLIQKVILTFTTAKGIRM